MTNSDPYSLSRIATIYTMARARGETMIAFEMKQANGVLVFMIFFSDDKESKDTLFLFLRRTKVVLKLKMYGDHRGGGTAIYLTDDKRRAILNELQLQPGSTPFDWNSFFNQVNDAIPQTLPLKDTLGKVREVWPDVKKDVTPELDDSEKTVLIGIRRLGSDQKPRDRTLSKLYVFTKGSHDEIGRLIAALKQANITLLWTTPGKAEGKSFADIFNELG